MCQVDVAQVLGGQARRDARLDQGLQRQPPGRLIAGLRGMPVQLIQHARQQRPSAGVVRLRAHGLDPAGDLLGQLSQRPGAVDDRSGQLVGLQRFA